MKKPSELPWKRLETGVSKTRVGRQKLDAKQAPEAPTTQRKC
ncbi:hypothetical protein PI125_g12113 [Phytophthora idaei]|nr:hypothetical protein PI125_g12113 [Phytophthora idaei]